MNNAYRNFGITSLILITAIHFIIAQIGQRDFNLGGNLGNNIDPSVVHAMLPYTPISNAQYFLQLTTSDKLFLKPYGSRAGAEVFITEINPLPYYANNYAIWQIEPAGRGWYFIKHTKSGLYLAVKTRGSGLHAQPPIEMQSRGNIDNQKFRFIANNNKVQIVSKIWGDMSLAPERVHIRAGEKVVLDNISRTENINFNLLQAKTYEYSQTIKCLREDDPGQELEIFGHLQINVTKGSESVHATQPWNRHKTKPQDIKVNEVITPNPQYLTLPAAWVESGQYNFTMRAYLYEHDRSSANDTFGCRRQNPLELSRPGTSHQIRCLEGGSEVLITGQLREFRL